MASRTVGTSVFHGIRRSMATGGRWVLIGKLTGETVPFNPAQRFLHGISMLSATSTTREQLRDSLRLLARKQVRPIVSGVVPLEAAAQAHEALERGALGRLLLDPAAAPVVA
jgi:NADPH:quinone reductase-like Zn-dependent oxidoreductase